MNNKIFLVGMTGSGKSYFSKQLAESLCCNAFDLDDVIELNEKKTISQIFSDDGEEYFRNIEAKILRSFATEKNFVLATGGGAPCFHNNMQWMNENGLTVWLNEKIEVLVERLKQEKQQRPLIKNLSDDELKNFLSNKLAERKPFYGQAKIHCVNQNLGELKKLLEQNIQLKT